ncbi:MAG: hypothetical protein QUV35_15065 [Hydrogenophaga sp.]|uniref:GspE/PulE/PilB domain-containing protein n=1 Tax=Hydrogenophaga sp. TaxID=1904254 RepID=UPI002608EB04|nr:hypothetical protein [Hydrogenophaga sp.]MDM7943942.1 hypothetical protein [Hydrogenophaga sp.]
MSPDSMSFSPVSDAQPEPCARNLPELVAAVEAVRRRPVIDLGQALVELRAIDPDTLARLRRDDPERLRARAHELVEQVLVSEDDFQRAMARVAGVVEVDAARFELDRHAFEVLSMREARWHDVLPLGPALDHFVVASWKPTSTDLQRQLSTVTSHAVLLVWGQREAIEGRLA